MAVRVCVVESQMTGIDYSFLYDGDPAFNAKMREIAVSDVVAWDPPSQPESPLPGEDEIAEWMEGSFNWMTGPAPDAED